MIAAQLCISLRTLDTKEGHYAQTQNCTYFVMHTHQVTLHGELIPTAKTIKYLGVKIQDDLKWNSHIEYITTNKASNIL